MRISFSPQRRDDSLALEKTGDVLTINGDPIDFSALPDGATVPLEAINNEFLMVPIERIEGELHVTVLLPHGDNPSQAVAFPEPITVTDDGPINVPSDDGETDAD